MGFGQRLKAAARTLFGGDAPKAAGGLLSGVVVNGMSARKGTRELLLAYRHLPRLHSVVHRIASDVAGVPLRLYRTPKVGRKAELAASVGVLRKSAGQSTGGAAYARKMLQDARKAGELVEVTSHPFLDLYRTMNPALRGAQSKKVTQIHLDLKGEGVWVLERGALSKPIQAWPVPPHWVAETPSANRPFFRMSWAGWQKNIPEADVVWFRDPDPEHPYSRGVGTGESLADELDVDEHAARRIKEFFVNGAMPASVIGIEDLADDGIIAFREKWLAKYQGGGKSNQVHFTNKKVSSTDLTHTFQEQQLVELRKHEADIIRQAFGVPPEILGDIENSNRATIDASYMLYALGVLCPRMDFLCDALEPLLGEWDEGLILDYVSPVPEDREFKKNVMVALPANYRVNEHRALAGEPPIDGKEGEAFYAPPAPSLSFGPPPQQLQGDPPWTKGLRPQRKDLTIQELQQILEGLRPERLTDETGPLWEERVREWGDAALAELGLDASFNMRNPLVRDLLDAAGKRITGVTDTTRQQLMSSLTDGVYAGEGIGELAKRVQGVFETASSSRARTIARTEVVGSSNQANLAAWRLSGVVEEKEWLAVRDGETRSEHAALDGQVVKLGAFFTVDGHSASCPGGFGRPELDINCFPGEVSAWSAAPTEHIFRHTYAGQLVEVATVRGQKLTGTPNHPVLTQRGWVPLGELNEADSLIHCTLAQVARAEGNNVQHVPSRLAEIFDLASINGTTKRVEAGRQEQFHGDGSNGDVDIVATDSQLQRRLVPLSLESIGENLLAASELGQRALTGDCLEGQFFLGSALLTTRNVGGLSESLPLGTTQAAHSQAVGLAAASNWDSGASQVANECRPGQAKATSDAESALPLLVRSERIAQTRRFDWTGHVFNLQTQAGWYIADGFVVHNCRCTALPRVSDVKAAGGAVRKTMSEEEKTARWKKFDKALVPWEDAAEEALRRGFRAQEADILEALRRLA